MSTPPIHAEQAASASGSESSVVPRERRHFKELLLADHFHTAAAAEGEPPAGDTTYEQLVCIGYRPLLKRLDAVVQVKLSSGYSGGICSSGSQEYVRFFASTDDGASWIDLGTTSFTTWDVAGPKPLEFDVSLPVDLAARCCQETNVVLIRAILSWEVPPAGPSAPVVWGNGLDVHVQVAPIALGTLQELLECLEIPFEPVARGETVHLQQIVEFAGARALTAVELHQLYHGGKVAPHRYLLKELTQLLANPVALAAAAHETDFQLVSGIEKGAIDLAALIAALLDPEGDETYEQLGCLGLDPNTGELVATVDVKLASGYSGNLCTQGSQEYVAFWVDWGTGFEYVGTASVTVHDIAGIPSGGLQYSAALPFPQALTHRRPCAEGPVTPLIRAVLSWATPPSTTSPYAVPVWGGHLEAPVLIAPGEPVTEAGPVLESIGSMALSQIDDVTGLATGTSGVGFVANDCPFGGSVTFTGHVYNAAGTYGGPGFQYRILVSTNGGLSHTPVTTPFYVETDTHGTISPQFLVTPDPVSGWVTYLEDTAAQVSVVENVLGRWTTSGDAQLWFAMEARQGSTPLGAPTGWKLIRLDNTYPDPVTVQITSGAGSCGDFQPGDLIEGSYSGADNENLRAVSISVEMAMPGATLTKTVTSPPSLTSESGTWALQTLPTTEPCGYTITATATDNTIVNSAYVGLSTPAYTGLCLRPTA